MWASSTWWPCLQLVRECVRSCVRLLECVFLSVIVIFRDSACCCDFFTSGNVYAWGCRSDGQLGDSVAFDGPDNIVFSPVLISALTTMSIHVSLAVCARVHLV